MGPSPGLYIFMTTLVLAIKVLCASQTYKDIGNGREESWYTHVQDEPLDKELVLLEQPY